jgi:hypothetical protein
MVDQASEEGDSIGCSRICCSCYPDDHYIVTGVNNVGVIGCFVAKTSCPLSALLPTPVVIRVPSIATTVVVVWARFSHVVFTITPTVGGFHQFGDGLR